jgi:dUTPase
MQLEDTGLKGSLSFGTFCLIIGRSSNYKKKFGVLPGVIDSDFQGEAKIMIGPLKETIQLHKNQQVAQIILLP